ncbi:11802_t:CDS:2 [Funneliformis mosseae]|uniref:11802_t:CDS:1 n=1 Tax=Funneliformis mosseae TaxID=27381 RepID=A0A9N8VRY3_FUNMO|nr:11802_t:CDS:2 [Funneliformis mosseae]
MTDIHINEIKIHHECQKHDALTKFYGITKDPVTEEFMLVLEYAKIEISTGMISYEKNHFSLALAIINGLRPIIAEGTPDSSCTFDVSRQRKNITNFTGLQVEALVQPKSGGWPH